MSRFRRFSFIVALVAVMFAGLGVSIFFGTYRSWPSRYFDGCHPGNDSRSEGCYGPPRQK